MRLRHRIGTVLTALTLALTATSAGMAAAGAVENPDATFLQSIHQSNLAAMAAGSDATVNAVTPCVRAAGSTIARDHSIADSAVRAVALRHGVVLPGAMTSQQRSDLDEVAKQAHTLAYDAAWLRLQEREHTEALRLIGREITEGKSAEVQLMARRLHPVESGHLAAIRRCAVSAAQ
ncbi:DUF4142 domain-containing protein [Streptomyces sp. URMC 123]|uniref:DUF4142 domain-containing protein n=1 Tax=Streptomyces sp. URMC 123 TaxID=3423403 RepID=UPI003F1C6866